MLGNRERFIYVLSAAACVLTLVGGSSGCERKSVDSSARGTASTGQRPVKGTGKERNQGESAKIVPCRNDESTFCFHDTAAAALLPSGADGVPAVYAAWIWFGSAGDSLELSLVDAVDGSVTSSIDRLASDPSHTAAPARPRLARDGVVTMQIAIDPGADDSAAYILRVRQTDRRKAAGLSPTGKMAILELRSGNATDRVSIIPVSMISSTAGRAQWEVLSKTYRVALTRDSLYEICAVPCSSSDTVKLQAGARIAKRVRP